MNLVLLRVILFIYFFKAHWLHCEVGLVPRLTSVALKLLFVHTGLQKETEKTLSAFQTTELVCGVSLSPSRCVCLCVWVQMYFYGFHWSGVISPEPDQLSFLPSHRQFPCQIRPSLWRLCSPMLVLDLQLTFKKKDCFKKKHNIP